MNKWTQFLICSLSYINLNIKSQEKLLPIIWTEGSTHYSHISIFIFILASNTPMTIFFSFYHCLLFMSLFHPNLSSLRAGISVLSAFYSLCTAGCNAQHIMDWNKHSLNQMNKWMNLNSIFIPYLKSFQSYPQPIRKLLDPTWPRDVFLKNWS